MYRSCQLSHLWFDPDRHPEPVIEGSPKAEAAEKLKLLIVRYPDPHPSKHIGCQYASQNCRSNGKEFLQKRLQHAKTFNKMRLRQDSE